MVGEREYVSIASIFERCVQILNAKYRLLEISYLITSRTFLAFAYGQMLMALQSDEFLKKSSFKIEELCKFTMMNLK